MRRAGQPNWTKAAMSTLQIVVVMAMVSRFTMSAPAATFPVRPVPTDGEACVFIGTWCGEALTERHQALGTPGGLLPYSGVQTSYIAALKNDLSGILPFWVDKAHASDGNFNNWFAQTNADFPMCSKTGIASVVGCPTNYLERTAWQDLNGLGPEDTEPWCQAGTTAKDYGWKYATQIMARLVWTAQDGTPCSTNCAATHTTGGYSISGCWTNVSASLAGWSRTSTNCAWPSAVLHTSTCVITTPFIYTNVEGSSLYTYSSNCDAAGWYTYGTCLPTNPVLSVHTALVEELHEIACASRESAFISWLTWTGAVSKRSEYYIGAEPVACAPGYYEEVVTNYYAIDCLYNFNWWIVLPGRAAECGCGNLQYDCDFAQEDWAIRHVIDPDGQPYYGPWSGNPEGGVTYEQMLVAMTNEWRGGGNFPPVCQGDPPTNISFGAEYGPWYRCSTNIVYDETPHVETNWVETFSTRWALESISPSNLTTTIYTTDGTEVMESTAEHCADFSATTIPYGGIGFTNMARGWGIGGAKLLLKWDVAGGFNRK